MSRIIKITSEEKKKILLFSEKVIEDAKNNTPSSWKLKKNYSIKSLCIGTIGELAYAKMTNQKVDMSIKSFGDKGIDFPDGAQVKTCTYSGPFKKELKVNNLKMSRTPKKFVLAHYDSLAKNDFVTLIGEISFDNFINKKKIKYYNNRPSYVVSELELDKYYS